LLFKKETIRNYTNTETGIFIKRCQHYSLWDNDKIAGHFYCGLDEAIGILNDNCLTITRKESGLTKRVLELKNSNNNSLVGLLAISNFVISKSLKVSLEIIHQDLYNWQIMKQSKGFSLFRFKTWSKFSGKLFNGRETATFEWDYLSDEIYKYKLEFLPVTGKIELSNPMNYVLLFAGMFLMEMELQLKEID